MIKLPAPTLVRIIMHCPACHLQHIDKGEWETKPHRRHLCDGCGHIWQPSIWYTVGVKELL